MALFNRFFGLRRKQLNKYQDNACEKLFAFTEDQVRIVVFRECDFRGRKLLFDSRSVEKVELTTPNPHCQAEAAALHCDPQSNAKKYVEVCNGHGYMYTKPNSDVSRLGEMIFGSVAMSYRGTTSKLHVLQSPTRIVCSQVFPSPRYAIRPRTSAPSHVSSTTASSLEQSVRLEDSGDSLATWSSEHSVHSNMSDTMLVCRRQRSVPLDVPVNSSVVSSSGFGELSHSSISSGPQSIPIDLSQGSTRIHSEDSLCRQWEQSTTSLPCSASTEESCPKIHPRISKIGLAVLIQLTENEEDNIEHFLMEHALLLESLIWRARRGVEAAYVRHSTFVSTMHSVAAEAARWLSDLMTGTRLASHVWHSLLASNNCDNLFSITTRPSFSIKSEHLKGTFVSMGSYPRSYCSRSSDVCENGAFLNISRYLKSDGRESPSVAEKFVAEFCELLESIDAKDTNFFISTLVTAVLTHHLGWVSTVYSPSKVPFKSESVLYHQLGELYGAVGSPVKLSRTIISGVTRTELIPKILNLLTYFIRCIEVERCSPHRSRIDFENNEADVICSARECIPKENYKRYEDHLREMKVNNVKPAKKLGITKTYTCLSELSKLDAEDEVDFTMLPEDIIEAKEHIERIVPRKSCPEDVVFVLGENEKLVGLKRSKDEDSSSDEEKHREKPEFENKASTSCSNICDEPEALRRRSKDHSRAQSEPPSSNPPTRYKYSGVKFNFQQYPQIFENYMRSKNIELASMRLPDKELDLEFPTLALESVSNGDGLDVGEPLTTPSNASELEFSSDLVVDKPNLKVASEMYEQPRLPKTEFRRALASNVLVKDADKLSRQKLIKDVKNHRTSEEVGVRLKMVEFPMPKTEEGSTSECGVSYLNSLLRGLGDRYIPDMVLQGTTAPKKEWHSTLKKDLVQSAQQLFMNRKVDESIAIVANIDTWEVQLMSSHTYVIDRNVSGVPVGMSQLVANMLDTLVHLWRLRTPAEFCILHIEQQLREVCLRSKALAQLLLDTDFCSIEMLTSTLRLEVNDVPLLMAVASTHTPKVTEKYGLSFQ